MNHVLLLKNKTVPVDPYFEAFRSEYSTTFLPLLTHTHTNKSDTIKYLLSSEFLTTEAIIITSQRAVEILVQLLEELPTSVVDSIKQNQIVYTVGPATSKVLEDAGFGQVRGGENAGNGSKLADIIIADGIGQLVFFTGETRRDIIPVKLALAGIPLVEKVIYKTENRHDIISLFNSWVDDVQQSEGIKWVVFFSPQGTELIVEYLQNYKGVDYRIASIGPTTEEYLVKNGLVPQTVSSKPQAQTLFQEIQNQRTKERETFRHK
ncbi:uncharacterized protein KQ657_004986 [Scheffersomyces spartinae]|uniref:Tetrapyrrole biosynthesis uroporphyrinogen III synthase domain-containing protein n=1 Tax=Scheffersomyces spartinae TaxID=45513 RepID=A0A9P7VBF1_9ASCO|nr:uncharacterized protein KQ657_004986 [Scheffersomyces spartinae]KAG7194259.1 hypothetical protein KQ657_004986 [Scheffersomyces spartinae]